MVDATRRKIWSMREAETAKSYEAFGVYLSLGPRRSLERAREVLGRKPGYARQLETWSSAHDWVKRAEAWDAHTFNAKLEARSKEREHFRQGLVDELDGLRAELVAIALGRCTCGFSARPLEVHHEACASYAIPRDRLAAIKECVALAGIAAPKKIEVTGSDGAPLKFERDLDAELENLSDEQLEKLVGLLSGVES